ncbi:cation transport ATPase (P-type) family protein [Abortiporus biennis]
MSPSCCSSSEKGHTSGHVSAAKSEGDTAPSAACCEGSVCGCDDACLDELARVICADDDGHFHTHLDETGSVTANEYDIQCASCDSETETCKCGDTPGKLGEYVDDSNPNGPLSDINTESIHACGLRKRTTKREGKLTVTLPSEACKEHKSIARNRYTDTLTAFGCVCKAMLARGLQSCCSTRLPRARSTASLSSRPSVHSANSSEADSCCGNSCCGEEKGKLRDSSESVADSCCGDSCCGGEKQSLADSCCGDSCCGSREKAKDSVRVPDIDKKSCCDDSCCGESVKSADIQVEKDDIGLTEKALPSDSSSLNHAVLAVKGMTCTGCENKLIRALNAIPVITHIKTSLVLCRAEFDYSGEVEDLLKLIQTIEKRTGFTAEQIADTSVHAFDVILDPTLMDKFLFSPVPDGVQEITRVNKQTARIVHDPHVAGCRDIVSFYSVFSLSLAPEPRDPALTAGIKHIRLLGLRTIMSVVLTIPVLVMSWAPLPSHSTAYAVASLVLASIVQTVIAGPFYLSAFKSLFFSGIIETDLLIVLSTTTAYIYSVVAFAFEIRGHPLSTGQFFETSTLLVTLIMVGQLISAFARQRAIEAISLRSLQQTHALLIHSDGHEELIDGRLLQYGDTFKVPPDSSIITDGIVISGHSEVDESMMTGESIPIEKKLGSKVIAGTSNGPSPLLIQVTRLPGENTISEISSMVDEARFSRAKVQEMVDIVCGWFVPVILTITIITFVAWIGVGIRVRKQGGGEAAVTALTYAIAVLAISCPCAIGLAVPMVILIASGVAAKYGVVFKSAVIIEQAKNVKYVVFDKTGTLTEGKLSVVKAITEGLNADSKDGVGMNVPSVVLGLVASSNHPVARAVAGYLTSSNDTLKPSTNFSKVDMVTGKGVQGLYTSSGSSVQILGGSPAWLSLESHPAIRPLLEDGLSLFCVVSVASSTSPSVLLAVYGLVDIIRPSAHTLLSSLRSQGITISILSGDHSGAVNKVANELGIPIERVKAGCSPSEKRNYIKGLVTEENRSGKKGRRGRGLVMFCGDGTNDAVALAEADIGVHISSSEPTSSSSSSVAASSAADVTLLSGSSNLSPILTLFALSRAVHRRIIINFAWSAVYNLVAILFASGVFGNGVRIPPAYAGLGEVVSVLPVVGVAVGLRWWKGGW